MGEAKSAQHAADLAVDLLFKDLRDRRFLKWVFAQNPTLIAVYSSGEEEWSIDPDVQEEIREKWSRIIAEAMQGTNHEA